MGAAVAAVIPVEGGKDVLGALVRIDDPNVDTDAVAAGLADLVPAHMIPQIIEATDKIPYNAGGGKIDRVAVALRLSTSRTARRTRLPGAVHRAGDRARADHGGPARPRTPSASTTTSSASAVTR